MNGSRSQRTLLVEIMFAVLFFALCATVLMRTFATAHEYSDRAGTDSAALLEAQDLAERLYAAADPQALLEDCGFARADGLWRREAEEYILEVELAGEAAPAGVLRTARIRALRGGETIVELPCVRYVPQEAIP